MSDEAGFVHGVAIVVLDIEATFPIVDHGKFVSNFICLVVHFQRFRNTDAAAYFNYVVILDHRVNSLRCKYTNYF